ncbi:hypothetical protein [Acinetobacter beijerinckii]|uniref:hypothetical protein n=1 Tax=Acinetobacter beijerinckii TaxID=262668 RepID=UPI0040552102
MNDSKFKLLESELNKPGINPALKFLLSGAGSLPFIGGLVSGSLTLTSDEALEEVHKKLLEWAKDAEDRIDLLLKQIELLTPDQPSKASLALLLGELFGDKLADELITKAPAEIPVILNLASLNELEVYISKKWVELKPTHSSVTMGCKNKIGNYIEELKRPYGNGNSFVLKVLKIS